MAKQNAPRPVLLTLEGGKFEFTYGDNHSCVTALHKHVDGILSHIKKGTLVSV